MSRKPRESAIYLNGVSLLDIKRQRFHNMVRYMDIMRCFFKVPSWYLLSLYNLRGMRIHYFETA